MRRWWPKTRLRFPSPPWGQPVAGRGAACPGRRALPDRPALRHDPIFGVFVLGLFAVEGRFPTSRAICSSIPSTRNSRVSISPSTPVRLRCRSRTRPACCARPTTSIPPGTRPNASSAPPSGCFRRPITSSRAVCGSVASPSRRASMRLCRTGMSTSSGRSWWRISSSPARSAGPAFGMVADRIMLSDTVKLDIRIRLTVGLAPGGR